MHKSARACSCPRLCLGVDQRVGGSAASAAPRSSCAPQEGDDCQDQENEEQYLRNACSPGSDAAETKDRRDDGDDEKYDCVVKHFCVSRRSRPFAGVVRSIFLSSLFSGYRRRPRFCVGRVRRTFITVPPPSYSAYVAAVHFATAPRVLRLAGVAVTFVAVAHRRAIGGNCARGGRAGCRIDTLATRRRERD